MWVTKRELARLERELSSALRRAEGAEDKLAVERQRHDWLILQLTNRVVTKHGGYGLEETKAEPESKTHPKGFIREPDEIDDAKLEYYRQCYRDAGLDETKALERWEAEMRGEHVPFENEMEPSN